jgi:hypothetical protein
MRAYRTLPLLLILVVVGGVLGGCSRGPSEEELKLAELQEQFSTIQQLNDALQQTRADLAAAEASVAEIEAINERRRSDEQKAQLEELKLQIAELTPTQDSSFEELSGSLAEFLNVALNDFPELPETAQVLAIYSEEAILVSDDMVAKAGDYKKAIDHLNSAVSLYEQIGLETYQPLTDRIFELDDWRFITQERFDAVQKNMTKEQVMEVAGVPYYQNIKIEEKRGVEMWLYRKREGGAAAVSFKIKNNKVYHKNFDAVKTKVVE